jgi:hypothetical protein
MRLTSVKNGGSYDFATSINDWYASVSGVFLSIVIAPVGT